MSAGFLQQATIAKEFRDFRKVLTNGLLFIFTSSPRCEEERSRLLRMLSCLCPIAMTDMSKLGTDVSPKGFGDHRAFVHGRCRVPACCEESFNGTQRAATASARHRRAHLVT